MKKKTSTMSFIKYSRHLLLYFNNYVHIVKERIDVQTTSSSFVELTDGWTEYYYYYKNVTENALKKSF